MFLGVVVRQKHPHRRPSDRVLSSCRPLLKIGVLFAGRYLLSIGLQHAHDQVCKGDRRWCISARARARVCAHVRSILKRVCHAPSVFSLSRAPPYICSFIHSSTTTHGWKGSITLPEGFSKVFSAISIVCIIAMAQPAVLLGGK